MGFTPEANFFFRTQARTKFFFCANQNQFFYFNLSINVIKYIIENKFFFLS